MQLNDISVVYVRRDLHDDLLEIMALADQCYEKHAAGFLVLDVSRDDQALVTLARMGDPFRYCIVSEADATSLIEYALGMTASEKLLMIDDVIQSISSSACRRRDVRLAPKSWRPSSTSGT